MVADLRVLVQFRPGSLGDQNHASDGRRINGPQIEIQSMLERAGAVSMEVVRVEPKDRLPNLSDDIVPNLMHNLPRYFCPHCAEYSVFEVRQPEPSPFSIEVIALFNRIVAPEESSDWDKADFLCRVCSRPVRVYFKYILLPVHKDAFGHVVLAVLETK
jgi:hypothetical protein